MTEISEAPREALSFVAPGPAEVELPATGYRGSVVDSAAPDTAPGAATALPSDTHEGEWAAHYRTRAVLADAAAAACVAVLAIRVAGVAPAANRPLPAVYVLTTVAAPILWPLMIGLSRGYDRRHLGTGTNEFRAIVTAAVRLLAMTGLVSYAAYSGRPLLSRYAVLAFFTVLPLLSLLLRRQQRRALYRRRNRGQAVSPALVVGPDDAIDHLVTELRRDPAHGLLPTAFCALPRTSTSDPVAQVMAEVARTRPEVVLVTSPSGLAPSSVRRLSWLLEEQEIELMMSPGLLDVVGPRVSVRPAAGLPLLHLERPGIHGMRARYKSVFDRVAAAALLTISLPALIAIAIVIRVDSAGPALFRQRRIGEHGQSFEMLKFRSMVPDAERLLDEVKQHDDGNGHLFKSHADPRITRVGRFLRKYSVDELPQLLNVLRGEMSLVGPRPPLQSEVDEYETDVIRRLHVKPGLTGLWQVSGRSDLSWEDSVRLDLNYVDNWSVILDLQILWRTARAVVTSNGAY
ncbi:sugar transferase [Flexivirga sp. B27]